MKWTFLPACAILINKGLYREREIFLVKKIGFKVASAIIVRPIQRIAQVINDMIENIHNNRGNLNDQVSDVVSSLSEQTACFQG